MSQPYPGAPVPYGAPYGPPPSSTYRPLRRTAIVSVVLIGLTSVAAVIQTVILWSSYEDVKRFVYGLVSEEELEGGLDTVAGSGPFLDLANYLLLGTAVAFVIWLWQARENTELFERLQPQAQVHPQAAGGYQGGYPGAQPRNGQHRHNQGWVVGSWVCPIVQFWYPLQVVQDVVRASEPQQQQHPGAVAPGSGTRSLLYGWWAAWTAFWVIIVGGSLYAAGSLIVWIVQLVDAQETSTASGDYVDIYDLQDFMVRLALGVCIGFTVATVLLIVSGALISVVVLRVTKWQDERGRQLSPGTGALAGPQLAGPQQAGPHLAGPQVPGPPLYGPQGPGGVHRPGQPVTPPASRPAFPSYGGGYQHQQPPGGTPPPWRPPD